MKDTEKTDVEETNKDINRHVTNKKFKLEIVTDKLRNGHGKRSTYHTLIFTFVFT